MQTGFYDTKENTKFFQILIRSGLNIGIIQAIECFFEHE